MDKRNVFLLSVDSLQYEYFSDTLTEISEAVSAVEFTNAVATAPETGSAMPGLAAGVFDDSLNRQGLPKCGDPTPMAEVFKEHGYATALWTDNYLFGVEYNYDRGFDAGNLGQPTFKKKVANTVQRSRLSPAFSAFEWAYFNIFKRLSSVGGGQEESFYRTAAQLNQNAIEWLSATSDQPQFLWMHYMDVHHPYEPPQRYLNNETFHERRSRPELGQFTRDVIKSNGEGYTTNDVEDVAAAYRASCQYIADELEAFIGTLRSQGHYNPDRDILVITADHGECLTPHQFGMLGHVPPAFFEEIIHVPLAIAHPDWERDVTDDQVSLIDLMPTLLHAAGLPIPNSVKGKSAETPADLHREQAMSVSNPFSVEGPSHIYRSLRDETGVKVFGAERYPEDEVLLTRFKDRSANEEEIHYASTDETPPTNSDADDWHRLTKEIYKRGQPIEITGQDSVVNKEHLRDLGYLE